MPDRFAPLRNLYARLDGRLQELERSKPARPDRPNACGTCFECCKYYFYLSRHEFDCLEDFLIRRDGRSPIRWVNCSTNIQDARRTRPIPPDYRCPLYQEGVGCTVYEVRPIACRTLGPMLPHHSRLPDWCVYPQATVYTKAEEIPLWQEFLQLIHEQDAASRGYFVASPGGGT